MGFYGFGFCFVETINLVESEDEQRLILGHLGQELAMNRWVVILDRIEHPDHRVYEREGCFHQRSMITLDTVEIGQVDDGETLLTVVLDNRVHTEERHHRGDRHVVCRHPCEKLVGVGSESTRRRDFPTCERIEQAGLSRSGSTSDGNDDRSAQMVLPAARDFGENSRRFSVCF